MMTLLNTITISKIICRVISGWKECMNHIKMKQLMIGLWIMISVKKYFL